MSGFAAAEQRMMERRQAAEEALRQRQSSGAKNSGGSAAATATGGRQLELWERRMAAAKADHRPNLKDWMRDGYGRPEARAHVFDAFAAARIIEPADAAPGSGGGGGGGSGGDGGDSTAAAARALCGARDVPASINARGAAVPRVHASSLSLQEFWERFEVPELPVIIQDVPRDENWGAAQEDAWSLDRLDRVYGDVKMKCGEDDDGYSIKVRLRHFIQYCRQQRDDSPLYIFDSHFDDHDVGKALLQEYRVPSYFPDDLFELVGERRRPPYRWFLVGPRRSGTCCHVDPLGTSAWNTVIVGRKRWVIFPPHTARSLAKGKTVIRGGEDDEAVNYFVEHLPRIRALAARDPSIQMFEFIQYPGETVFIPGGWWHAVINLDDTVAVTQNFCSRVNFAKVWEQTRGGRKKMAVSWLKRLHTSYPHLAQKAERMNREDRFVMGGDKKKGSRKSHKKSKGSHKSGKSKSGKHSRTRSRGRPETTSTAAAPPSDAMDVVDSGKARQSDGGGGSSGGSGGGARERTSRTRSPSPSKSPVPQSRHRHHSGDDGERERRRSSSGGGSGSSGSGSDTDTSSCASHHGGGKKHPHDERDSVGDGGAAAAGGLQQKKQKKEGR